jgi:CRP-like cAMP-binding protein
MKVFDNLTTHHAQKGTILLQKGDFCTYAFKVNSGCLKSYVIDSSGKEHILQFAPEGWLISDMDSFYNDKPSVIFIDAIEDTEYLKLGKTLFGDHAQLDANTLKEQSLRLTKNIISANKRLIGLLSATAEERYLDFIKTYPTIAQRLPLKLIAAYIGVTPEYLSEIRRKLAKK